MAQLLSPPHSPPPCRRCCRKTNATPSWPGDSRQPGRRARDHRRRGAGGPGPLRYLQLPGGGRPGRARSRASPTETRPPVNSRSGSAALASSHGVPSGTQESRQEQQSSGGGEREGKAWGRLFLWGFLGASGAPQRKGSARSLREPGSPGPLTLSPPRALAAGSLLPTGMAGFLEGKQFCCQGCLTVWGPRSPLCRPQW